MTSENPSSQQKPGRMTEMTLMAQLLTSLRCRLKLAPSRQPYTWLKSGPRCSHFTKATVKWDWWPQLDTWLHLTSKPRSTGSAASLAARSTQVQHHPANIRQVFLMLVAQKPLCPFKLSQNFLLPALSDGNENAG